MISAKKILMLMAIILLPSLISCSLGDDSSPDTISDLSIDSTGKLLRWTSPGDDGGSGEAILYLIRFFDEMQVRNFLGVPTLEGVPLSDITGVLEDNFDDASQVPEFLEPQEAGNTEFLSIPRIDLTGSTTYFFTIATNDEVGNTADISNVIELTTPLQQSDITSSSPESCIGTSLAVGEIGGVEDENDDDEPNINDLIIGDPCAGRVYIFFGGVRLIQFGLDIDVTEANVTIIGDPSESFGASVSRFGDFAESVNFDEIAIGAPDADGGRGKVYIVYGDDELPSIIDFTSGDEPDVEINGEFSGDRFGAEIQAESNLSDDIIIGAPNALSGRGRVYVYDGDDLSEDEINLAENANEIFTGENPGDHFGTAIAALEDVDNSSPDEVAISAPGAGRVYIFFDDSGKDLSINQDDVVVIQGSVGDRFGESISGGFNLDGELESLRDFDGNDDEMVDLDDDTDFVIGAPGTDSNTGAVFVYNNDDMERANDDGIPLTPVAVIRGENPGDQFGTSVEIVGDINPVIEIVDQDEANVLDRDDTNGDIAVGAPGVNGGAGAVFIFFGEVDFSGNFTSSDADFVLNGNNPGDSLGSLILNGGDINDDDFNDFLLGGPGFISAEY
ncbi:MAG: hypothetical protein ACRENO_02535 [Thermodesulfobacteriota bacterium]